MLQAQNEAETHNLYGADAAQGMAEPEVARVAYAPEQPRYLVPVQGNSIEIREVSYGSKSVGRELMEAVILSLLIFVLVQSVIQNRKVDGESMEPTLSNEQHLLIDRISYFRYDTNVLARVLPGGQALAAHEQFLFGGPQRGDIVVFKPPVDERDYIKRVVAVAGETVEVKAYDGVYVDGVRLDEPYEKEVPDYSYGPLVVPSDHVFVLGDNRRNSSDSHAWGPLAVTEIVGRAWLSYLPIEGFGFLPHPSYASDKR